MTAKGTRAGVAALAEPRPRPRAVKPAGLPKPEHLTGMEFLEVIAKGRKHSCDCFHLYTMPAESFQAGVSVSRKLGSAVERNRIKRVLRESVRLTKAELNQSCRVVLVARRGAEVLTLEDAKLSLSALYANAKLSAGSKS